jgi:hypothetical protein
MRTRIVRTRAAATVDLTAPTPPAAQSLASSATTASVTFTHPGAPGGTTYALVVTDEADAEVTPDSGSGLGPYVFPVAAGKAYKARLTATGTDGQSNSNSALVEVAAAGGATPGWDAVLDLDLTGLTDATLPDQVDTVVTRADGGAEVATVWSHSPSNAGVTTASAAGITSDGASGTGSVTALIDIATAAGLALPGDILNGVAIDFYLDNLVDFSGSGTAWRVGIAATQARFSTGSSNSVQGLWGSGANTPKIATNEAFTTWTGGFDAAPAGAWTVTLLICEGSVVWAWSGAAPPSDADLDGRAGAGLCSATVAADVTSPVDGLRYSGGLYCGIMAQIQAGFTWTRVRVRQRRIS